MNKKINSMKKITAIILSGLVLVASSCSKQLDINNNPNAATSATPELILPQALNYTAGQMNSFNTYGAQVGGYSANAGGYGGFGTAFTYNFASSDYGGLFTTSYDLLEDYQSIINQSNGHWFTRIVDCKVRNRRLVNLHLNRLISCSTSVVHRYAI